MSPQSESGLREYMEVDLEDFMKELRWNSEELTHALAMAEQCREESHSQVMVHRQQEASVRQALNYTRFLNDIRSHEESSAMSAQKMAHSRAIDELRCEATLKHEASMAAKDAIFRQELEASRSSFQNVEHSLRARQSQLELELQSQQDNFRRAHDELARHVQMAYEQRNTLSHAHEMALSEHARQRDGWTKVHQEALLREQERYRVDMEEAVVKRDKIWQETCEQQRKQILGSLPENSAPSI